MVLIKIFERDEKATENLVLSDELKAKLKLKLKIEVEMDDDAESIIKARGTSI